MFVKNQHLSELQKSHGTGLGAEFYANGGSFGTTLI